MAEVPKLATQACHLCKTGQLEKYAYIQHILSKRHQKNLKNATPANSRDAIQRTVHVAGYDPRTPVESILAIFWKFKIRNISHFPNFSFIEFQTVELAKDVLRQRFLIGKQVLKVSERHQPAWGQDGQGTDIPMLSQSLQDSLNRIDSTNMLDSQIVNIVREIELRQDDLRSRENLRKNIEMFFAQLFPSSCAYVFGSSSNNLGFRGCDVDLYMDLGVNPWAEGSKEQMDRKAEMLTRQLAKDIRRSGIGINVQPIARARVPIVKFVDHMTRLQVDLSFKHGMPLFNTELIRQYTRTHHLVRPYLMIIRYWAKIQRVSGGGAPSYLITNYAFTMLMLFYLMVRSDPVVPSVDYLKRNTVGYVPGCHVINGWDCGFGNNVSLWTGRKHNTTILELVAEFFEYFAKFEAHLFMISPLAGRLVKRSDVSSRNIQRLPLCMAPYCSQDIDIKIDTPLCVQDVFEQNFNITKGLHKTCLDEFQVKCKKAAEICRNILNGKESLAKLLEPIDDHREEESKRPHEVINVEDSEAENREDDVTVLGSVEKSTEVQSLPRASTSSEETPGVVNTDKDDVIILDDTIDDKVPNGLLSNFVYNEPELKTYKFVWEFTRCFKFTVTLDGEVSSGDEHLSDAQDISEAACSLMLFILKEVLKIDMLEDEGTSSSKKRKSISSKNDEDSAKRMKAVDGESVPLPAKYRHVAQYECTAKSQLWIGRKKVSKRVPQTANGGNPLKYEMTVTEIQVQTAKEEKDDAHSDSLQFTLGLWQECQKPANILVTASSNSNERITKAQMMPMFTYLSSVANVLLKRMAHYLSTSFRK